MAILPIETHKKNQDIPLTLRRHTNGGVMIHHDKEGGLNSRESEEELV